MSTGPIGTYPLSSSSSSQEVPTHKTGSKGYSTQDSKSSSSTQGPKISSSCFSCIWTAICKFFAFICPCLFGEKPSEAQAFIDAHTKDGSLFKHYKKNQPNPALIDFKNRSREVQIDILHQFTALTTIKMEYIISYILESAALSEIKKEVIAECRCTVRNLKEHHREKLQVALRLVKEKAPRLPREQTHTQRPVRQPVLPSDSTAQQSSYDGGGVSSSSSSSSSSSMPSKPAAFSSHLLRLYPDLSTDPLKVFVHIFLNTPNLSDRLQEIFIGSTDRDKSRIIFYLMIQKQEPQDILIKYIIADKSFFAKVEAKIRQLKILNTYTYDVVQDALRQEPKKLPDFLNFLTE